MDCCIFYLFRLNKICVGKHMNVDCLFICLPYIWRQRAFRGNTLVNKNIKKMKFIVDIVFDSLYYIQAPNETAAHEIEISVFEN